MNKVWITVATVLLALLGLVGWRLDSVISQNAALRAERDTLVEAQKQAVERQKRDRKVLVARQAEIASQARKLAQAQEALSEALTKNKVWANEPVPNEVQEALTNGR